MIMASDKKDAAGLAVILGQPGPEMTAEGEMESIDEELEMGLTAAAEEMMVSFEAGDVEGVKTALRSFVEMVL